MKKRNYARLLGIGLILVLTMAASKCDRYAKAGELAKDAAAGVLLAQQEEIALFNQGKIDTSTHQVIQQKFLQLADAGQSLDRAINTLHSAQGAQQALQASLDAVKDLSSNGLTGIKDEQTKLQVQALLLSVQITLNNIAAFGGAHAQ